MAKLPKEAAAPVKEPEPEVIHHFNLMDAAAGLLEQSGAAEISITATFPDGSHASVTLTAPSRPIFISAPEVHS